MRFISEFKDNDRKGFITPPKKREKQEDGRKRVNEGGGVVVTQ